MANTTNFNWETPDDTDLVKDGAAAIRTLGSAIDTSLVDLKGGTTGQILAKNSNTDMDFIWASDASGIPATIFDAKGDIIAASAADTAARLAVGSNNQVLTADSSTATGLKWASPAAGGKVLQVINVTYATSAQSSSSTMADTGLTASITPSSASNKVLVMVHHTANAKNNATRLKLNLLRGSTVIQKMGETHGQITGNGLIYFPTVSACYLDNPATTSSTTYKTQFASLDNISVVEVQSYASDTAAGVSSITLMEIGA
jgi:hypothetical protein